MDRRKSSHIVPEIYEATIDPAHWDYVVTMIAKLTGSKSACLYYKNKDMEIASTVAQYGLPRETGLTPGKQFDKISDMFNTRESSRGKHEAVCTQFYPGSNGLMAADSRFYLEWMKPHNIFHVGGAQFADSETHRAGIAILRDEARGAWADGDLRVIDCHRICRISHLDTEGLCQQRLGRFDKFTRHHPIEHRCRVIARLLGIGHDTRQRWLGEFAKQIIVVDSQHCDLFWNSDL